MAEKSLLVKEASRVGGCDAQRVRIRNRRKGDYHRQRKLHENSHALASSELLEIAKGGERKGEHCREPKLLE